MDVGRLRKSPFCCRSTHQILSKEASTYDVHKFFRIIWPSPPCSHLDVTYNIKSSLFHDPPSSLRCRYYIWKLPKPTALAPQPLRFLYDVGVSTSCLWGSVWGWICLLPISSVTNERCKILLHNMSTICNWKECQGLRFYCPIVRLFLT